MSKPEYKYSEDLSLKEIQKYIDSTYGEHYVGANGIQVLDLLESIGSVEEKCRCDIIKYAARFGKKDGKNRKDLLKIIHYAILWLHFSQEQGIMDDTDGIVIKPNTSVVCDYNHISDLFK